MAVAVKNTPDTQTRPRVASLALASILGAVYVLAGVAVVAWGVPTLWEMGVAQFLPASLSFVSAAGLIIVLLVAVGLLAALGSALVGPAPPKGLRAGVFTVLATALLVLILTDWAGRLARDMAAGGVTFFLVVGMALALAALAGVLYCC